MRRLCIIASKEPSHDLVCPFHLLAIKWSRGILFRSDVSVVKRDLYYDEDGFYINKYTVSEHLIGEKYMTSLKAWCKEVEKVGRLGRGRGNCLEEDYDSDVEVFADEDDWTDVEEDCDSDVHVE
ncbi:hypothetical protein HK104_009988 [Borealophlyctis nickersoniae]|nr:hypothetical protein HK104_009988 [Borealophlyctis nickersoniae]